MTRRSLEHLLGSGERDPGCDAAFDVFDEYVDAVRRGDDVQARFADFLVHLKNCDACREDTAGLIAALDEMDRPPS